MTGKRELCWTVTVTMSQSQQNEAGVDVDIVGGILDEVRSSMEKLMVQMTVTVTTNQSQQNVEEVEEVVEEARGVAVVVNKPAHHNSNIINVDAVLLYSAVSM